MSAKRRHAYDQGLYLAATATAAFGAGAWTMHALTPPQQQQPRPPLVPGSDLDKLDRVLHAMDSILQQTAIQGDAQKLDAIRAELEQYKQWKSEKNINNVLSQSKRMQGP